ncbi:MAG: putative cardiolipin synthase [Chlamydiales bacterium]|jgi:putative cardiolipin synthase
MLRTLPIKLAIAQALFASCAYPRLSHPAPDSFAFDRPEETYLGSRFEPKATDHPGSSGLYLLSNGLDAFSARVALINRAERTLDAQYYIFHEDVTGKWLLSRLLAAADRGVRVRLLLDDLGSAGTDELISRADAHPQLEVRLFNPFARGPWPGLARKLDILSRPRRLNRRMHNKMLTADGAAAIVGGRNVGDEYFSANEDIEFGDMDLLAFGPVNHDLGECFDLYWNSEFVVPMSAWSSLRRDAGDLADLRAELAQHEVEHAESRYAERVQGSDFVQEALMGDLALVWAETHTVADLPRKIVAKGDKVKQTLLIERIKPYWPDSRTDLAIVSPYFIPRKAGVEELGRIVDGGGRVRVLTNSLAATDVPIVHSGYKDYRRALVRRGVELHELMPVSEAVEEGYRQGKLGSSNAALHTKTFVSDGQRIFVGSLNLDPRSVELNTELGLVVESPELARQILAKVDRATQRDVSWTIALDDAGDVIWLGERAGGPLRLDTEPDTSWWLRCKVWMMGLLPIEGQL